MKRWLLFSAVFMSWFVVALSAEPASTNRIAWNETVELGKGFWMRLAYIKGERWLGVITRFPGHKAPSWLEIVESTNGCRAWATVARVEQSGRHLDNGNLLVMPDGAVLLTCRSLIDGESFRLPVFRSKDRGRTWAALSNIDSNEGATGTLFAKGLWEPHLFFLPDGRVSVVYSNEKHAGYSQILSEKVSKDGAKTWGEERRIVEEAGGGKLRPGMGVPARMSDGRFILVYEIVGRGNADVYFKISKDGLQWPEGLGTEMKGQHAAPFALALTDGSLLVTSASHQISLSTDLAQTWQTIASPWDMPFKLTWPALYQVGTNRVLAVISNPQTRLRFGTWKAGFR
ncbi:MAG: exo-alpha-sialidase [Verrucomicrobiales bacterium]|nr:exo-alpha-sialidase [Verrucomicrobiales bacterium]